MNKEREEVEQSKTTGNELHYRNKIYALPHKLVMDVLKKYNRVK